MKLLRWSSLLAGSWGRDGWGFPWTGYVPGPWGEVSIERLHSQQKRRDPDSALCHAACQWQPTSVFLPTGEAECHCFKAPPQRAVEPSSGTWSEQALDSPSLFFSSVFLEFSPLPTSPLWLPLPSFLIQVCLVYIHAASLPGRPCPTIWPQVFWNQACVQLP